MKGLETSVVKLRHEVFKEVARVAFEEENVNDAIEAIPYLITPTEVPRYNESIYRERAIAGERVRLAMGMSLRPADKPVHITEGLDQSNISDKYYEPPLMQVIPSACDKCEDNVYEVSNQCRGCVAKACVASCPKDAIFVENGKNISYVCPQRINKEVDGSVKLFFRVRNTFKNCVIRVKDGEKVLMERKKKVATPGEMETLILTQEKLSLVEKGIEISLEEEV